MRNGTMGSTNLLEGSEWLDPLERQVRGGVRQFLQELIEQEVTEVLGRLRHGRAEGAKRLPAWSLARDRERLVRPSGAVAAAGTGAWRGRPQP